jgi:carboxymethylenebutenolidase
LDAAGKTAAARIHPGVNHGFHNDSTPRDDEAAAGLAWSRTTAVFDANRR